MLVIIPVLITAFMLIHHHQNLTKSFLLRDQKMRALFISESIKKDINLARNYLKMGRGLWQAQVKRSASFRSILTHYARPFSFIQKVYYLPEKKVPDSALLTRGTVKHTESQRPVYLIYEPVMGLVQQKGFVVAQISLQDIIKRQNRVNADGLFSIYLLNNDLEVIASNREKAINTSIVDHYPFVLKGSFNSRAFSVIGEKAENATNEILGVAPIGIERWSLVCAYRGHAVSSFLNQITTYSIVMVTVILLLGILASYFLARFINVKVQEMIEGTERLAQGDYSHRFRIPRKNEIGKLLYTFNKMSKQLEKAQRDGNLSELGKTASQIAHELKNSLLLVNTFISMLPKKHKDKEFINEFSETIPKELDYWNKMLKQMMDSARPEKVAMEYVDINKLLNEIVALAQFGLDQKHIQLHKDFKGKMPPVFGDADKLKQVFLNLLTNAIDAAPSEGMIKMETRYLDFNPSWTATFLEVKLTNVGVSLSDSDKEKVFKPYFTTKREGHGLGLPICKEIIKQHGGVIEVNTDEKKQVSFSVQLPINKDILRRDRRKKG